MAIYTIEVHKYPTTIVVEADNESDAKQKAKEKYYQTNSESVYSTEVIEVDKCNGVHTTINDLLECYDCSTTLDLF